MSRKLTYAAGLVYAFSLAESFWRVGISKGGEERIFEAVERLWELTQKTPLDLLAEAFSLSPTLDHAGRNSFDAYDSFLGILATERDREHLDSLDEEIAHADPTYEVVRELGKKFQYGLSELFLHNNATPYPRLTDEYGVF